MNTAFKDGIARLVARTGLVHNIRRGFATNSSSSHSFVFFNDKRPSHDLMAINHLAAPDFGRQATQASHSEGMKAVRKALTWITLPTVGTGAR